MKTITNGTNPNNKREASFVVFFARSIQPYKNYQGISEDKQNETFPAILMLNRHDMRLGFVGGGVDAGETVAQAGVRETKEEINVDIIEKSLKPVCSHDFGDNINFVSHLNSVEVDSFEALKQLQMSVFNARDYGAEITGSQLVYVVSGRKNLGLGQILKNSMATSVREELVELILQEDLMSKEDLSKIVEDSGFNLDDLLV